jgi:hypothetical protein
MRLNLLSELIDKSTWNPFSRVDVDSVSKRAVIPAKAGIHLEYEACNTFARTLSVSQHSEWIPAFAGMTSDGEMVCRALRALL